jgi:hypothetical protein
MTGNISFYLSYISGPEKERTPSRCEEIASDEI